MSETPSSSEGEFTHLRSRDFQFRTESRYKSPLAALAYVRPREGNGKPEMVWLANVSANGVGFLTKTAIPAGTQLWLHLNALGSGRESLATEVVHSTQQLNGDWLIGSRLESPLSLDDLESCLTADDELFSKVKR